MNSEFVGIDVLSEFNCVFEVFIFLREGGVDDVFVVVVNGNELFVWVVC